MKTLLIIGLSFLLVFSQPLQGQQPNFSAHPKPVHTIETPPDCGETVVRFDKNLASTTDSVKCYYWYDSEEWLLNLLYIHTYDENGRLSMTITQFLDLQTQEFTNSQRNDYTYYPNDSLKTQFNFLWNQELDGGSWDESSMNEYEYNEEEFISTIVIYFSPYGEHALNPGRREFYNYNAENLVDTVHTQYWNTNEEAWFYSYRYRYYYNAQMNLVEEYSDWANGLEETFSLFQRISYSRFEDEKTLIKITQYYDSGSWLSSWRDYHFLNELQLSDSILFQQWNTTEMMWDTTVMDLWLFDYNASGKMTEFITQSIYIHPANVRRQAYYYDENDMLLESLVQDWSHADSSWWNKNKCSYPTTPVVTGVFENQNSDDEQLIIYPNPANDFIEIQSDQHEELFGKISIFNTRGQLVKESVFHKGNKISVEGIPPGIYLVQISGTSQIKLGKLLIP